MRHLTLVSLLLLACVCPHHTSALSYSSQESIVLVKGTVVVVRKGQFVKDFPGRRKATIRYPVVKGGLSDPVALGRVRSLLRLKNIFDTSLEEYRQDTWLTEFDYRVDYNKNFILDITFTQEGVGAYPDTARKHLAIDLRTGKLIKARDVFKIEALNSLAELVNKKLQAEMKETVDQVNKDQSISAEEKARVPELYEGLKFEVKDLDDFSISDDGITFLYDAGFPHVVQAYQPVGQYKFSFAELSPYLQRKDPPRSLTR